MSKVKGIRDGRATGHFAQKEFAVFLKHEKNVITVKELFGIADTEGVARAYMMLTEETAEERRLPVRERIEEMEFRLRAVRSAIKVLRKYEPRKPKEAQTVFAFEYESVHWDDRGRTELICLLVKDAEAEEELAYEGIERIEFHDISMFSMMEIAGIKMARSSVAAYGPEVCCALILRGMFSFGCREPAQGSNYAERDIEERFSSEVIDRNIERLTAMLKAEYYPLYGAHAET